MKSKLKIGMGIFILGIGILATGCNGASNKKNTKTNQEESQTVYTCPMHPEVMQYESGDCPTCGMKLVEKLGDMEHSTMQMTDSIYTCPMHPKVVKHEPGSCPKCGMDLKLKESKMEHSHDGHMH
nr:heavy metal-binding domain-containing protein [uncultured Carboxylicivirga sp.]